MGGLRAVRLLWRGPLRGLEALLCPVRDVALPLKWVDECCDVSELRTGRMSTRHSTMHSAGQCRRAHVEHLCGARHRLGPQNSSLRAFAGKALTMVLAGFAFTMTNFPKISFLPALVAFFWRVFTITTPGITNLPLFFSSFVAMLARVLKAVLITPFFTSQLSASDAMRAPLVMTVDCIIDF